MFDTSHSNLGATILSTMIDIIATVERNEIVRSASGRDYGLLRLGLPQKIEVLPGQFAMIKPLRDYEPLLRRAMAYYQSKIIDNVLYVEFIYQILGRGKQSLARLKRGDGVAFLGSLGNTYDVEASKGREALLVAGGVGSAALFMLAEELVKRETSTRLFIGAMSSGDLCGIDDFIE